jgi:hypothetical protein
MRVNKTAGNPLAIDFQAAKIRWGRLTGNKIFHAVIRRRGGEISG